MPRTRAVIACTAYWAARLPAALFCGWYVELSNQEGEAVATYELLTMDAYTM